METGATAVVGRGLVEILPDFKKWGQQLATDMRTARTQLDGSAAGLRRSAATVGKSMAAVGKGTSVLAVGVAAVSVKMAADFQAHTAVLQTAAGETTKGLAVVRDGIKNIAVGTGTGISNLTDGMYTIEKAGFRGADGLQLLRAAAQGAREENAKLADVTNAMTSVMASYHLKATASVRVMNAMKTAAGEGKITMEEFSGALSTVLPIASANKIKFEDVAGSMATLTQHGTTAREATHELAATIRALASPNLVASREMARFGLSAVDVSSKLGQRGLSGTVNLLVGTILSKMGPAGVRLQKTFEGTKQSSQDAQIMLGKMSGATKDIAEQYLKGKIGIGEWNTAMKGADVDQRPMLQNFKVLTDRSRGFSRELKNGGPASQTFTDALKKMSGGAIGLNTVLQITGESSAGNAERIKKVGESFHNSSKDVEGWQQTSKLLSVQMDRVKAQIQVMAIDLGTKLIPAISAVVGFFAQHRSILLAVAIATGVFLGATAAAYVGMKLYAAYTRAATIATAAWNVAMTLGTRAALGTRIQLAALFVWQKLQATWTRIGTAAMAGWNFVMGLSGRLALGTRIQLASLFVWQKLQATWTGIGTAAIAAWNIAMTASSRAAIGTRIQLASLFVWQKLQATWTGIVTAAQWAWNAAMTANPIGLIIVGIGLLVGAIVWIATKTNWFQRLWGAVWGLIRTPVMAFAGWLKGNWPTVLAVLTLGISSTVMAIVHHWGAIKGAFAATIDWVKANWPLLLGILTLGISTAVLEIVHHWHSITNGAQNAYNGTVGWFNALGAGLHAAYTWMSAHVFSPIGSFFTKTIPGWASSLRDRVVAAWRFQYESLLAVYRLIHDHVFSPIGSFFTKTIPGWAGSLRDRVMGRWASLRDGLSGVYSSIRARVFSPIGSFFTKTIPGWASSLKNKVVGFFGDMRDGVGRVWSGIQSKTKAPINWVLDHVWNKGIYSTWGTISKWIGISNKLGKVKMLAAGGTVGHEPMGVFNKPTAIVGEGSSAHPEYVIPTDPKYATRAKGLWQAAGAHFMEDGGILGSIGHAVSSAAGKAVGLGKSAMGFLTNPLGKAKSLLAGPLKQLSHIGTAPWAQMVAKLPHMAVDGLLKAVKSVGSDLLSGVGLGASSGGGGGSGVQRWAGVTKLMLRQVGQPESLLGVTLKRMNQESGGNPDIVNRWDSNWQAGHPSVGLMQVIGPTFRSYAGKYRNVGPFSYGVSTNPAANIYSSMKYALSAYGSLASAYGRAGGYATGTDGATAGWHWVGENGPELAKLPAGTRIRSATRSGQQAPAASAVVNLTVQNHGVIGSRQETENWLAASLDQLRRRGRLPAALGGRG